MLSNYFNPDRHYHNMSHVADLLMLLPEMVAEYRDQIKHMDELVQAVIWHDETYVPGAQHNEAISARQAVRANPHLNGEVIRNIVMATRHTGEPLATIEEQIMVDIDLHGLALDFETFTANTDAIRLEYGAVSDEDWKAGRGAFYRAMLARPRIYYTDLYHSRLEKRARVNLQMGLEVLDRPKFLIYECPRCYGQMIGPPSSWTTCQLCGQDLTKMAATTTDESLLLKDM
jgi:predicted metal-dependent HD superfamily phosphohydrolase